MMVSIERNLLKTKLSALSAAAVVLMTGCIVTSVHPFYTEKDLKYEPSLLGAWTNTQSLNEIWTFEKESDKSYRVTYFSGTAGERTNLLQGRLFSIAGANFLDFMSSEPCKDEMPPSIPSHLLLKVTQMTPSLRMTVLDHDWLQTLLDRDPQLLQHMMLEDKNDKRVVLTAPTSELQAFLVKHLATQAAWKDPFELKRAAAH